MARTLLVLVGVLLLLSGHLFVAGDSGCPAHSHLVRCVTACPMVCEYVHERGDSNKKLDCPVIGCFRGCECDENYVRRTRGEERKCVPEHYCIGSWWNLWGLLLLF